MEQLLIHTCDGDDLTDEQAKLAFCLPEEEGLQVVWMKMTRCNVDWRRIMINENQIQAIYEIAQKYTLENHKDVEPAKYLFLVDEYLKHGVLAQMWVIAEENFGSTTRH